MNKDFKVLRKLLIELLLVWGILFLVVYTHSEAATTCLAAHFAPQVPILATNVLAPLLIPIQIAIDLSFFLSIPVALLQLWRFVAPGLFVGEKTIFTLVLVISLGLFVVGLGFGWKLILPFAFSLLSSALPTKMIWAPTWQSYYEFILQVEVFFGLALQIPLIICLLVRTSIVSISRIKEIRAYAVVGAFTLGMLVTPPDVTSQILVAIPLCLLFEIGIMLGYLLRPKT